jgi:hypothetical protein
MADRLAAACFYSASAFTENFIAKKFILTTLIFDYSALLP